MDASFSFGLFTLGSDSRLAPEVFITSGSPSVMGLYSWGAYPELSGSIMRGAALTSAISLPGLLLASDLTDNQPVLPALGLVGEVLPGASISAPVIDGVEFPGLALFGEVGNGAAVDAHLSLPALDLIAGTGISAGDMLLFDSMEVFGTANAGAVGAMLQRLPLFELAGAASDAASAAMRAATLPIPILRLEGAGAAGGRLDASAALPALSMAAAARAGGSAGAAFVLGALEADGRLHAQADIGVGLLALPMLTLSGQGALAGLASVASGEALVVNIKTAAVTRYEQFGFNSFAVFAGRQIAASRVGIYALGGDSDNSQPIQMVLTTSLSDLGEHRIKRVREAFIGYRADGSAELHVRADDADWYVYRLDETRTSGLYRTRVKVGRAIKGAYLQFSVRNVDGAFLSFDAIEPVVEPLSRRGS